MPKKKAKKKKVKKVKKVKKAKKKVVRKKVKKAKGRAPRRSSGQGQRPKAQAKEKIVGIVDHFFGKISVCAFKVKNTIQVGDMIHVKGHTTDFVQRIDSIQSEHQSIPKAKKGVEVGIKVKGKVRAGDTVFLSAGDQGITAQASRPSVVQQPMFPKITYAKPKELPQAKPAPRLAPPPPKAAKKKPEKPGGYTDVKFMKF